MAWPQLIEFLPEAICLGVDCLICGILYKVYSSTNEVFKSIEDAPVFDLDTDPRCVQNLVKSGPGAIPYAVIEGSVSSSSGAKLLKSQYDDSYVGVIRQFSIVEHKRSLSRSGFWYDSSRTIQDYVNSIPFILTGKSSSLGSPVQVHDWSDASRLDLEITHDHFEPAQGGLGNHVWGWIIGDRQKGVQTTEKMMLDQTPLTAIGELVWTAEDKISVQSPTSGLGYFLVKDSRRNLIRSLQSESKMIRLFLIIFGGVGLFVAGVAGFRFWRRWKSLKETQENRERLRRIMDERPASSEQQQQFSADSVQSCVVCLGRQREVILLECGHVCVCADCAMEIMATRPSCPVCRADIERIAPAFIS